MYRIVFDADGLLKTYKAGFLEEVTATYFCLLPEEVFQETVTVAKRAHPEEVEGLERFIQEGKILKRRGARSGPAERLLVMSQTLGTGERGALRLYFKERADSIVTDDRAFLNLLTRHRIPFLTPPEILYRLRTADRLSHEKAEAAAERLRPIIRHEVYQDLKRRLEELP
ncbi:MAG TPA: hypothetical protein VGC81_07885 [Candidatus Methylomirabilis sp.]|jgi:hypothetical protein